MDTLNPGGCLVWLRLLGREGVGDTGEDAFQLMANPAGGPAYSAERFVAVSFRMDIAIDRLTTGMEHLHGFPVCHPANPVAGSFAELVECELSEGGFVLPNAFDEI